eukprot:scaffold11247_cov28-Tisochrysis_lutea.AAC.4
MDRRKQARSAPGTSSKLGSPGLSQDIGSSDRRPMDSTDDGWRMADFNESFRHASRPISVTVRVAPV